MPTAPRGRPDSDQFEEWELDLTSRLVGDFAAQQKLPRHLDEHDLYQECLVHWWRQRGRYLAERGASRGTYLRRVVESRLQDLARRWRAAKRGSGQAPVSLDAAVSPGESEGVTLGETLADPTSQDPTLALDIRDVIGRLSLRQRRIISAKTQGLRNTEISRLLDVSRTTVQEELSAIRGIFRDAGLAPFLEG